MDPLIAEFIGVILRWLLTSIGGYLVAHHVLEASQSEKYVTAFAHDLALGIPVVLGLLWGLWAKYKGRLRFIAAQEAPRHTSEEDINDAATKPSVKAQAFTGPL